MSKDGKRLLAFGDFELDREEGLLFGGGEHVPLAPKVFQTLLVLVESGGRLLTKEQLMKAIWPDTFVEEHNLTLNIHALRKTLNKSGGTERYIETVPRRGYRFIAPVREIVREPARAAAPGAAQAGPADARGRRAGRGGLLAWLSVGAVLALAVIATIRFSRAAAIDPDSGPELVRLTSNVADDRQPDVSPDGRTIVFVTNREGGKDEIYAMDADGGNPRNLTKNPANDNSPAWSPDGRRIAFQSDRRGTMEIFVMDADGGHPVAIAAGGRASWSADGKRIAFQRSIDGHSELFIVDAAGGEPRRVTFDQVFSADPSLSPDGTRIAFTSARSGHMQIDVMRLDGSQRATLTDAGQNRLPVWAADGKRLMFNSDRDGADTLYVMNADGTLQHRLLDGPSMSDEAAWWPGGRSVIFESDRDGNSEIYRLRLKHEPDGAVRLTNNVASDDWPSWSPDGKTIAFASNRDGKSNIFVMDADGGEQHNLTRGAASDSQPAWSPDGSRIAFASDRTGAPAIFEMHADGSGVRQITEGHGDAAPKWSPGDASICFSRGGGIWVAPSDRGVARRVADGDTCAWSPDGLHIFFDRDKDHVREIYSVPAAGGAEVCLTRNGRGNGGPAVSRDGASIAFNSNRDGRLFGIFLMNADGSRQQRVSGGASLDEHPAWAPDGKWIAFVSDRDGNNEIYKLAVR